MLNNLFNYIEEFFNAGIITHNPSKKNNLSFKTPITPHKSLFEYMTSGRGAEIRAQQALYPYLLAKYPKTTPELKIGKTRIDFFIPNVGQYDVAIELKHYSPHQSGQFKALLGPSVGRNFTIAGDLKKLRPRGMILLQVALYTTVEQVTIANPKSSSVPFVKTYVARGLSRPSYELQAKNDLGKWQYLRRYYTPRGAATSADFIVPKVQHTFGPNLDKVSGRVCFFMAFARPSTRCFYGSAAGPRPTSRTKYAPVRSMARRRQSAESGRCQN